MDYKVPARAFIKKNIQKGRNPLFPNYMGHIGRKPVYEANGPLDYMDDVLIRTERGVREVRPQLLGDEPTHMILGHFEATDPNTKTEKYRKAAYTPYQFMEMVLGAYLMTRQAYDLIVIMLLDIGYEFICEPLVQMQRWSQDQKLNSSISHATQRVIVQAIRGSNTQRTVGPAACRPGPP
jgi:hypothetical protein